MARGSNKAVKPDELAAANPGHVLVKRPHLTNDYVIDMEGVMETSSSISESEDRFPGRWNHFNRRSEHTSSTSTCLQPCF